MNDPAWLVNVSEQNKNIFAYKLFSALLMLGYQTEIAINGVSSDMPHRLALYAFQNANGLPQSDSVTDICLGKIDEQLVVREQELASAAQGFQLYGHMQPLHANDISKDALAAIYSLPMKVLPAYLQMSQYEEVQCINSQCNGFIQDSGGNTFSHFPIDLAVDDYRFVGAYFDPLRNTPRKPSAAVHVQTVLHEYGHYIDGFYKVLSNNPLMKTFKIIDTTGFYAIGYDLNSSPKSGCFVTRSSSVQDWISKYAAQLQGFGGCPNGSAVLDEDWAESFSMYVASGRDFRAAATQSTYLAQKYTWLKNNVFNGLEYDTDLVRDTESGCNDVYLYGATGAPGYAHCNNNYIWDFTLKPLAATIDTTPAPFAFPPQVSVETVTQVSSAPITVSGINWPTPISVSGGEYSINGGAFLTTAGVVNNNETVTVRQTSSVSYGTLTDTVLTIGDVSAAFSVTTRTPLLPAISGSPVLVAVTGIHYSFTPVASNAISFSLGGNVPPGLNFSTSTGTLDGTPTTPGSYGPVIISAINGNLTTVLPGFIITVSAPIGAFTSTGAMSVGRLQHTATLLSTGKVLVAGGYDGFDMPLASVELFDPATHTWSAGPPMLSPHADHTATLLQDGRVLVVGVDNSAAARAELFDPVTNSWTATAPMINTHLNHGASLLPDGRVLVTGGFLNGTSAELYDPIADSWHAASPLPSVRWFHSSVLLQNGKVLVVGGYDEDANILSSSALYDPVHNSWSAAASMQNNRTTHTATMLQDGTVLVAAGYGTSLLSSVERYNPAADSWSAVAPLNAQRYWHTATLLKGGMVLVAGGQGADGILAAGEVYNPSTGSWSASGSMAFAQGYHSATLLTNGEVLLAGGISDLNYGETASQLFNAGVTQDYSISFSSSSNGSVTGIMAQKIAQGGSTTSVIAVPASGFQFVNWTGSGGFVATNANPLTVAPVSADMTITANFSAIIIPVNGACGSSNGAVFTVTPSANLCTAGTAGAVTGSGPWNWSCTGTTTAACSAAIKSYSVVFAAGASGSVAGVGSQTIKNGGDATPVTALPGSGYQFVNWTGGGGFVTSTTNPLTIVNVTADMVISANFAAIPPINGVCGSSNGSTLQTAPTTNLCISGAATAVTGIGPWSWTCTGANGGTTAACTATIQSTANPPATTNARVFLGANDTFSVRNSGTTLYGNAGNVTIKIASGVTGVRTDANIGRIELPGNLADYKFIVIAGTGILVLDAHGSIVVIIPSLNQDTTLAFADGSASLVQTGGAAFALGGIALSTSNAAPVAAPQNAADTSTVGASSAVLTKARVFLGANDTFTVSNSGTTLYGNAGNVTVKIASVVSGVKADANIGRIELSGTLADYTFVATAGTGILVHDLQGSPVATISSLNQETTLAFADGSTSLVQTGAVAFALGGITISSTTTSAVVAALNATDKSSVGN
jgi:hypothetical protein